MATIRLINDNSLPASDFTNLVEAVKYFVPLVTKAWNINSFTIEANGSINTGDWVVYITEKNRKVGAAGYHTVTNDVPIAYCSLRASGRTYGTYIKPLVLRGKQILPARYTSGLVTVVCHEIAEMLCDPQIKTISGKDAKDRTWLIEVCDHVFGSFQNYVVNNINCVLPDVTTPAFYDVNGKAPYSLFNAATAPFTMTAKGYGYYYDNNGKLIKL